MLRSDPQTAIPEGWALIPLKINMGGYTLPLSSINYVNDDISLGDGVPGMCVSVEDAIKHALLPHD